MALLHEHLSPLRVVGLDQRRVLREPGLVLSGNCRDRLPHLGSLPEKLNHTPHQEEGIRNPEKYGKPGRKGAGDEIIPRRDFGEDLFVIVSPFIRSRQVITNLQCETAGR